MKNSLKKLDNKNPGKQKIIITQLIKEFLAKMEMFQ